MHKAFALLIATAGLSACVSGAPQTASHPPRSGGVTRPSPQVIRPAPSTGVFRAPKVMNLPGLESVIGKNATALANIFGAPRLEVKEGDAVKLQFIGQACVLDIYLYPLRPKAEPRATYVAARRASDAQEVDRATCVATLRR